MTRYPQTGLVTHDWLQIPYPERLQIVREALARLQAKIAAECPGGEDHHYEPYSDAEPPTCPHCGFADSGLPNSAIGKGKGRYQRVKVSQSDRRED